MKTSELKNKVFTDKMFYRLFVPSVLSALGLALGDVADALFVGIRIGNSGLATMSLVVPVYMIFNVLDVGIGVSASVAYSKALGRGKAKDGISVFSQLGTLAMIVSVIIGALGLIFMPVVLKLLGAGEAGSQLYTYTEQYLRIMFLGTPFTFLYFFLYFCIRCDDGEKLASVGYTVGYLTDIAATVVFVLILGWDVKGAILATVLGKIVGIIIFLFHFTRKWTILCFRFTRLNIKEILFTLKTGMSSSVGYLFQFAVFIVINNILMRLSGDEAVAEFNVVQNISYLSLAIFSALGETVQPLCSTFFSEHNEDCIKRVLTLAYRIGIAVGGVISVVFIAAAPYVCSAFGLSENIISGGAYAVRMFCLSAVPAGISIITVYCYQSIGREKEVLLINLLRTFSLPIVFSVGLSFLGEKVFWLYFLITEAACICVWMPISKKRSRELEDIIKKDVFSYMLDTNNHDISELMAKTEEYCEINEIGPKQMYYVNICVEETCQAIIENAFKGQGDEYIQITLSKENGVVIVHIRDNALTFNPFDMKTGNNYLEEDEDVASLGIQMVKKKAKNFFYRRYNGFNTLTVEIE